MLVRFVAALGVGALLGSCGILGGSCTEIGCGDHFGLTVTPGDRPWPAGRYALNLTLDAQTHACEFALPMPATASGDITCNPVASVRLEQSVVCTETKRPDGSRSESCAPVPDRALLRASISATPSRVLVTLAHDGSEVLRREQQISYRTERPNGPGCDPACRQASLDLTWP